MKLYGLRLALLANKQRKRNRYRFDVDFNSLEGNDAFITRLHRTRNASVGKMLARYWSAKALSSRLAYPRDEDEQKQIMHVAMCKNNI